jgi:sugar/nucleoside kinase (ribokinase family)
MSILVLGTVVLDTVKTPLGFRKLILGGSAAHFSMSARLFTDVHLVAVVGDDFPRKYIKFLKDKGLNLLSLVKEQGKTFHWQGEYRGDLNNAITLKTELGVLATFKPKITREQSRIKNIFLANVDPEIQDYLLSKIHSPKLVAMDTMNYWINTKRKHLLKLLKKVNIFVVNDQEARDLTGEVNVIKAAKALRSFGPGMVLVKKGEHGVLLYSGKLILALPAYPQDRVVDPTGAGDTFAGGFMGYLVRANKINEITLKKALGFGTMAASFNIEDFGLNKTKQINLKDLSSRLSEFRRSFVF